MKYTYLVTVEVEGKPGKNIIASMIQSDVGSWEGSLPTSERITVTNINVTNVKEEESE